jgi:2-polyprenyl-6-methoxyphenol hydroxylase-like FAD-dependent oxidoreductase
LVGDAAHIHSPMGARGMNLGLEDAWVFAHLFCEGRLDQYNNLRRPVDRGVVHQVELLSRIVAGDSLAFRLLRRVVFPSALRIPFLRNRMMKTLTGPDHDLPFAVEDGATRTQEDPLSLRARSQSGVNRTAR